MSQLTLRVCAFCAFTAFIACFLIETRGEAADPRDAPAIDGDPAARRINAILFDYEPSLNAYILRSGGVRQKIDVPDDLTYLYQLSPVATLKTLSAIVAEGETKVAWKAAVAGICVGEESSLHLLLAHGRNFDTPDEHGETPRQFWLELVVRRLQEAQQQEKGVPVSH